MRETREKLMEYLEDALAMEMALVRNIQAHIVLAEGTYRTDLEQHLTQTRDHARRVQLRLGDLGWRKSVIDMGIGAVQSVFSQALALAKAPVDALRGPNLEEKLLLNARDDVVAEALEIATYDLIEGLARNVGDAETEQLARDIRAEEESMFAALRKQIPSIAEQFVEEELGPVGRADTVGDVMQPREKRRVPDRLPIAGYETTREDEILERLPALTQVELATLHEYERDNRNRSVLVERIEQLQEEEPWPGYDDLNAGEVRDALKAAPRELVEKVRGYENRHKNRSVILKATERRRETAPPGAKV